MTNKELRAQLLIENIHLLLGDDAESMNESFIKNILKRKKDNNKKTHKSNNNTDKHYTNNTTIYGISAEHCSVYYASAKDAFDKFYFGKINHDTNERTITIDMIKFDNLSEKYLFEINTDDYYVKSDGSIVKPHIIDFKQSKVSLKDASKYGFKVKKGMK